MTLVYRSTVGRRLTVSEGDGNISHLASGSVISVKQAPFNAVGDGVTDDTAAIQAALNHIVSLGGGSLDFGNGKYNIATLGTPASGTALLMNWTTTNTRPVALIGHGAQIIHNTDADKIMLLISGTPGGGTPWTAAAYKLQDFLCTGITFVGTRVPNDTDIDATQGNTLLYLSYVENARVTNCKFINSNGGVYFFARNLVVQGNEFVNANAGIQGSNSQFVVINNNSFSCPFKCDDQIAVFATTATATRNILIQGNQIDKGYDGLKGVGGTRRGWASGIKIGDYVTNCTIDGNVIANSNSVNASDLAASTTSLGGIMIENTVSGVKNLTITNNTIYNCRNGVYGGFGVENLIVRGNTISDCEQWGMIFSSTSTTTRESGAIVEGNIIDNVGNSGYAGSSAIKSLSADVVKILNNIIRDVDVLYPISVGMGGGSSDYANDIDVSGNTIYSGSVPTEAATAYGVVFNRCNNIRFDGNKINYRCVASARMQVCGTATVLSSNGNILEDFTGTNGINFLTDSIPVISVGNYERPNGGTWAARNLGLKRPDNLNNQSRSLVVNEYTAAPGAGTWIAGDRVDYKAPAAAAAPGAVCTTGGTPGTWKAYAVIAA